MLTKKIRILNFLLIFILALSLIFLSFGCAKKTEDVLDIGVIAPLTGEIATYGVSTKQGIELATEEWNTAGGINNKKIKLHIVDNKGEPTETTIALNKLIDFDKVIAVLGPVISKCALAAAPIAQQKKIPLLTPTATNAKVTEAGDYIFRACFIDPFQGRIAAKFATQDLK